MMVSNTLLLADVFHFWTPITFLPLCHRNSTLWFMVLLYSLILWCSQIETRRRLIYSCPTLSDGWSHLASWIVGKMGLNHHRTLSICPKPSPSCLPFPGWSRSVVLQFTSVFSFLFSQVYLLMGPINMPYLLLLFSPHQSRYEIHSLNFYKETHSHKGSYCLQYTLLETGRFVSSNARQFIILTLF